MNRNDTKSSLGELASVGLLCSLGLYILYSKFIRL